MVWRNGREEQIEKGDRVRKKQGHLELARELFVPWRQQKL